MIQSANRTKTIVPFYAVEMFKQASALAAQGHDIISLGIGEPDFTAPAAVVETLQRAADAGLSGYSEPAGLPLLRESVAQYYDQEFGTQLNPDRVMITAGASGALSLATLALINPGDEILMPDPSYPANQNFVLAVGGVPRLIPCSAGQRFQLDAQSVAEHWTSRTRGVLIASPNNPTGASIAPDALEALVTEVRKRDGIVILDEIYLGLYFDSKPKSGLLLDDNIIVINSFSKYFHMTGWRLGWLIAPPALIPDMEKIASSLSICAPTLAQHAALTCFEPEVMQIYEKRRLSFKQRRDYLLPEFERLGLQVPVAPDGAFYIYADIRQHSKDSVEFATALLEHAGVATVPGLDFGPAHANNMLRFSYATGLDRLEEAVDRIAKYLG